MKNGRRITRPVLRYFGGKWRIAPWVVGHLPPHRCYVEPFAGAASVLMHKSRAYAEVLDDLDDEVVNLFRVLQDADGAAELERLLRLTPFARAEFELAYRPTDDPIERGRRTIIKAFMGFGSNAIRTNSGFNARIKGLRPTTGFRSDSNRSGTTPARDWSHYPDALHAIVERLQGVVVESRDALEVIQRFDRFDTLTYADPPYVRSTRRSGSKAYRHEMTDDQHRELAAVLHACNGMVVLSGYHSPLYDELYGGWHQETRRNRTEKTRINTEVLWFNERAAAALTPTLWSA